MSETVKQVRKDALDWVNGEEHTEEWDADVVITRCVKALDDLERERAEWEANAQRENAMLVQAQDRERSLYNDVLRCIPADWKPDYARDWGHVGNILAEFVSDQQQRIVEIERWKTGDWCDTCNAPQWVSGIDGAHLCGTIPQLQQRIAALEAEAQDVQRVEAWREREPYGRRYSVSESGAHAWVWSQMRWQEWRTADSLAALGRMLKEGE